MSLRSRSSRIVEDDETLGRGRNEPAAQLRQQGHTVNGVDERILEQARIRVVTPEPQSDKDILLKLKAQELRAGAQRDESQTQSREVQPNESRRRSTYQRFAEAPSRTSSRRPNQQPLDMPGPMPQTVRHRHSHRDISQLRPSTGRTTSDGSTVKSRVPIFGSPFTNDYANATKEPHTRPRTRTLDERRVNDDQPRDTSPSGFFRRPRARVGSVASTTSGAPHANDETLSSIGHPSATATQNAASLSSQPSFRRDDDHQTTRRTHSKSGRTKLSKAPPPLPLPALEHGFPDPLELPIPPRAIPTISPTKTLSLMRQTMGRMEGVLAFRRGETAPWSLAYCTIDAEQGSLVYEPKRGAVTYTSLISDLRCCSVRAAIDPESSMPYMDVSPPCSHIEIHLRPQTVDEFESWFAALLCWRPILPKGVRNRKAKTQPGVIQSSKSYHERRRSEVSLKSKPPSSEGSIIKVGTMILWDRIASRKYNPNAKMSGPRTTRRWRRVSGHLWESGEFKIFMDQSTEVLHALQLNRLSRWAVQRLHPSILDANFSIAIYPQYTSDCLPADVNNPILLTFETRVLYEVWLVLLRAFTLPSLYGPVGHDTPEDTSTEELRRSFFRMDRTVNVQVIAAQINPTSSGYADLAKHRSPKRPTSINKGGGHYIEILLDEEIRARTAVKAGASPFWSEKFNFSELPSALSQVTIVVKEQPNLQIVSERQGKIEAKRLFDATGPPHGGSAVGGGPADPEVGTANVYIDDLSRLDEVEDWYTLTDRNGRVTGRVQLSLGAEEKMILMAREYQPLSELLHQFSNNLTLQIAEVLSLHVNKVAEYLLNIFQVSGKSGDWLMALVEDEIDNAGDARDVASVSSRIRFSKRLGSPLPGNESSTTLRDPAEDRLAIDRELFVRDASKSAMQETNVLFRGNTLCTKSLDLHMRRLGHEYLQNIIGDKMKEIADKDPDCEVDPNKMDGRMSELDHNWKRLLLYTNEIWRAIAASASQCPPELRVIFRHVMGCSDDRWGDHKRTVKYTSVSGFFFLRFFCPAVLSPQLFGLLKSPPGPGARTTFKFIAKILQNLANMSTFGLKETWMEPANYFVTSHRQQFKDFIDIVCGIPAGSDTLSNVQPSYNTPIAMLSRLSPGSQEGFASLPYLIDHPRSFADLVTLWVKNAGEAERLVSPELKQFHEYCIGLKQREIELFQNSEYAEKPTKDMEEQWQDVLDELMGDSLSDQMAAFPEPPTPGEAIYGSPPSSSHQHANSSRTSLPYRTSTSYTAGPHAKSMTAISTAGGGGGGGAGSLSSSLSHYAPSSSTVDTSDPPRVATAGSTDATGALDDAHAATAIIVENGFAVSRSSPQPVFVEDEGTTALPGMGGHFVDPTSERRREKRSKDGKEKTSKSLLGRFGKKK